MEYVKVIDKFKDKYAFLSNYKYSKISFGTYNFACVESAFQGIKDTENIVEYQYLSPSEGRYKGRHCNMRPDWETIKDQVMYALLIIKFCDNTMESKRNRSRLMSTGDAILIEGTTWHDNYWGNCTCERCRANPGENKLGKILMEIRKMIAKKGKSYIFSIEIDQAREYLLEIVGRK